ncbi:hypothetical protein N7495_008381 [Penicillium taxi]|uniref:uncharacterized protein n=1 Tax=Penicillium taxi TaxID=168475 RepID=UPI0025451D9F|nr:uncharacterized protein N7495_008381 [Penicillium taxi]KAJ5888340.1 hypothetical protein N7495_008381 [Penicillium taxi]
MSVQPSGSDFEVAYASPSVHDTAQAESYAFGLGNFLSDNRKRRDYGTSVSVPIFDTDGFTNEDFRLTAAKAVWSYLQSVSLDNVSVEIMDRCRLSDGLKSSLIPKDHIFFRHWEPLLQTILGTVDLGGVTTIGCLRRGHHSHPTVLITVARYSDRNWPMFREAIIRILDEKGFVMMAVEIMRDKLSERVLEGPGRPGQSLSAESVDNGSGSLGGFLSLKSQAQNWDLFALTCFHCILPKVLHSQPAQSRTGTWKSEGVYPSDIYARTELQTNSPSLQSISEQIAICDERIKGIEQNAFWQKCQEDIAQGVFELSAKQRKAQFKNFAANLNQQKEFRSKLGRGKDELGFGSVWAASGFKSKWRVPTIPQGHLPTTFD